MQSSRWARRAFLPVALMVVCQLTASFVFSQQIPDAAWSRTSKNWLRTAEIYVMDADSSERRNTGSRPSPDEIAVLFLRHPARCGAERVEGRPPSFRGKQASQVQSGGKPPHSITRRREVQR
jgi:hypothetical protein